MTKNNSPGRCEISDCTHYLWSTKGRAIKCKATDNWSFGTLFRPIVAKWTRPKLKNKSSRNSIRSANITSRKEGQVWLAELKTPLPFYFRIFFYFTVPPTPPKRARSWHEYQKIKCLLPEVLWYGIFSLQCSFILYHTDMHSWADFRENLIFQRFFYFDFLGPSLSPQHLNDVVYSTDRKGPRSFATARISATPRIHLCDLESDKDGWTVIMQRFNMDLDFNQTWQAYK